MPYITPEARRDLRARQPMNAGELNYAMCILAAEYMHTKGISYQSIAEVMAAFECGKAEFYRCFAAPYEQGKRESNGDVWT